jgi:iron complex outermembrane recepter protein
MNSKLCIRMVVLGASTVALLYAGLAGGQTPPSTTSTVEPLQEVVVTGSHLGRTDTEAAPLQVITAEEMQQSGFTSTQDVLHNLTANGQGTLGQNFTGNIAVGGSAIALRGLNAQSTLVLIDGHRTAPFPIGDDGYRPFVDVSNLPFAAIDRIEVLKDGASAIYGSDAIAGVVNIILKKSYEGASVSADSGVSKYGDGSQFHVSGIWGVGNLESDGHNFYLSAEFRKQNVIRYDDRPDSIFTQTDFTPTGGINVTPGVSNILNGGLPASATGYITNANGKIVGFMPGCNSTEFAANECTFRDTWDEIQPPTTNTNVVGRFTTKLADDWQVVTEGGFFRSTSELEFAPPGSYSGGYQGVASAPGVPPTLVAPVPPITIPDTNPTFPSGTGLTSGILHYTLLNLGPSSKETDARTYRAVVDLDGQAGGWKIESSVGYTEVDLGLTYLNEVDPTNLQIALNSTTNPFLVGQPNNAAVNSFISPPATTEDTSNLIFGHVGASRELASLSGGPLGLALGADYFTRNQHTVSPSLVAEGLQSGYNIYTIGTQQVGAGYAELDAPVAKTFDIDAAARYDHYNLSGGKASPKIEMKFTPIPQFALRGTAAKGFRAPGPGENGTAGQSIIEGNTTDPILCPNPANPTAAGNFVGQCSRQLAGLQTTNPNLRPEVSTQFTVGMIANPVHDFSATLDFWSIKIEDQIVPLGTTTIVRGTSLAPLLQYQANGSTELVAPPVSPIAYEQFTYINDNTTKTTGFDLGLQYQHDFGGYVFTSKGTWSYTETYDVTIDGVTYHLAGTHGPFFYSSDTGNPRSRFDWANTLAHNRWSFTATVDYIGPFSVTDPSSVGFGTPAQNTCLEALTNQGGAAGTDYANVLASGKVPAATSCNVASFTTLNLYGRYNFSEHFNVHVSATNALNAKAPLDWATYGGGQSYGLVPWNPSFHLQGAIGAFYMLGATYTF